LPRFDVSDGPVQLKSGYLIGFYRYYDDVTFSAIELIDVGQERKNG